MSRRFTQPIKANNNNRKVGHCQSEHLPSKNFRSLSISTSIVNVLLFYRLRSSRRYILLSTVKFCWSAHHLPLLGKRTSTVVRYGSSSDRQTVPRYQYRYDSQTKSIHTHTYTHVHVILYSVWSVCPSPLVSEWPDKNHTRQRALSYHHRQNHYLIYRMFSRRCSCKLTATLRVVFFLWGVIRYCNGWVRKEQSFALTLSLFTFIVNVSCQ